MVKVDLITGFLGSGKTTFIKKYASYLMEQGQNIGILENDFGAINVDMMLLRELEGENCELEMVAGGCDKDCYRRRFRTKLIAMGMCGYDRVLIEPSGIFDVDDFFDALNEEPLDKWYQIGNVITVVDACLEENLSEGADYILASEAANAGCILLSRTQQASEGQIKATVAHINRALEKIHCKRTLKDEVVCGDWEAFSEKDYKKILESGYQVEDYEKNVYRAGRDLPVTVFDGRRNFSNESQRGGKGDFWRPGMRTSLPYQGIFERRKCMAGAECDSP